jgi:hypothetical protein
MFRQSGAGVPSARQACGVFGEEIPAMAVGFGGVSLAALVSCPPLSASRVARWRPFSKRSRAAALTFGTLLLLLHPGGLAGGRVHGARSAAVPAGARLLVSRTVGAGAREYWVTGTGAGLRARNASQGLTFGFSAAGVVASGSGSRVSLALQAVGRGTALRSVGSAIPRRARNRVSYDLGEEVTQWFANGPMGLEQGFTLRSRPRDGGGKPLTLQLRLAGRDLRAVIDRAGDRVTLQRAGSPVFRYGDLAVQDALGRTLRARFVATRGRLSIQIDDRAARYPLRVDPVFQSGELTASDGVSGDALGDRVAVSGGVLVAAAPTASVNGAPQQGALYVFTEPASGWSNATEVAKLTASDGAASDELGSSVAISGDTIVAGSTSFSRPGRVYVFTEPASGWHTATQSAELTASDGTNGDDLGASVAISGATVVAGAPGASVGGLASEGAVYEFDQPAGGWGTGTGTETAKLTAATGAANALLGASVAVSNGTIAAGAPGAPVGANAGQGLVDVFTEPPGGWQSTSGNVSLSAGDGAAGSELGASVAISGQTIAATSTGSVYVFAEPGAAWVTNSETAELGGSAGDASVAVSGNTIVTADDTYATNGRLDEGIVSVYLRGASGWTDQPPSATLEASDGGADTSLGRSVAVSGATIAAGARGGGPDVGAVYVFGLVPVVGAGGGLVTGAGSELVSGSVDGRGFPVSDCHFEFGLTSGYGMSAPCAGVVGTDGAAGVSAQLVGLASGSTYHYRVVATNEFGTSYGADASFVTAGAPVARTGLASGVSRVGAVVSGSVDPEGLGLTACEFEYGTTLAYGQVAPCPTPAGGGTAAVGEVTGLSGLAAGQTYHFRLVASSAAGASMGVDESFRTLVAPAAVTGGVSQISRSAATIAGRVDPEGESVSACYFELGLTKRYGIQVRCAGRIGSGASAVRARVSGLAAGSKYHYRVVIVTPGGTTHGTDHTLTTKQPPRPVGATIPPALFGVARTYTEVIGLRVTGLRRGVRVAVGCRGGGCPFRSRVTVDREICAGHGHRCRPAPNRIDLTPEFKRRRLRPGTVLTIEITEPDTIGKSYTFTMHAGHLPTLALSCLGQRKGCRSR